MSVHFIDRYLFIDDQFYGLPHPIDQAIECEDLVLALFDPDSSDEGNGKFHNLVALIRSGQLEWTAELPTSEPGDRYYKIASTDPPTVYSARSYECLIDLRSGHIVRKYFTK